MEKTYRQGTVGALLDEYEKAISELQICIKDIPDKDLTIVTDATTTDLNCRSLQTILSHVVSSAFSYAVYVQALNGYKAIRPDKIFHTTVKAYIAALTDAFVYTTTVFKDIKDPQLEQPDHLKKVITSWEQTYDIEQMMEHAIVHVLRHRRQIEKIKIVLYRS
jgi:uncharacterized damage-inducible protein DinB